MPRHNSQDRPRRRSQSSSNSEKGKNPGRRNRRDGASAPGKKDNSFGSDKRIERPKGKFDAQRSPRSGEQKPSYPQRKSSSEDSSEKFRREDQKARPYKGKQKGPFKKGPTEFPSTGLRRERPYKKADQSSQLSSGGTKSTSLRKGPYDKKSGRPKKPYDVKGKDQPDLKAPVQTDKIRLNKFIANSGVCSRREADELIKMGLISVNGKVITELGYKVNPGDEVRHESRVLHAERPVYILLNKPKGFLTTTSDPQERNTVMHLIGNTVKERVYPIGRLDRNTTGLLLLTNDGDLADKLMHPSYNVKKIYKVELDRPLTKADAQLILEGVRLDEGKAIVDDLAIISDDKRTVGIEIHIGWNRIVRRIFESLNYEVIKLDRSVYAGLDKKNLGRGEWRFLTKEELVRLKHYQ